MSEEQDPNGQASADFKTPIFSASLKGKDVQLRDIVGVIILVIGVLSGYAMWEHKMDASASQKTMQETLREGQRELSIVIRELTTSQREMVSAQREQNCLIALPPEVRESRANFCKQITR